VAKAFLQNVDVKNVCLRDTQIVKMRPQHFINLTTSKNLPKCF